MKLTRITNPTTLDTVEIKNNILTKQEEVIIQFDEKVYSDKILNEINELASELNQNFVIRFYGHKKGFDCVTLLKLDKIKNLSIDCMDEIKNFKVLSQLQYLKILRFGVENFKEKEFLQYDNFTKLEELNLYNTYNINLKYIAKYHNLKSLYLIGKFKNIQYVGTLKTLQNLHLGSINKNTDFQFVNSLDNLKKLSIWFGSRENINEITNKNIEELSIMRVRGLNNLDNICNFVNLKKLIIEDQAQLSEIVFEKQINCLYDLRIINCKNLTKIEGYEKLTTLKSLVLSRLPKVKFENFITKTLPNTLEHINFYTATKQDKEIQEKIKELGYKTS